jgi:hypothetical protein
VGSPTSPGSLLAEEGVNVRASEWGRALGDGLSELRLNAPASRRYATTAAQCAPAPPNFAVSPAHTYLQGNWFAVPERLEWIP